MNTNSFLNGLLTGIVVGASIGILFAPQKGSEIRQKISEGGNALKSKMNELKEMAKTYTDEIEVSPV